MSPLNNFVGNQSYFNSDQADLIPGHLLDLSTRGVNSGIIPIKGDWLLESLSFGSSLFQHTTKQSLNTIRRCHSSILVPSNSEALDVGAVEDMLESEHADAHSKLPSIGAPS